MIALATEHLIAELKKPLMTGGALEAAAAGQNSLKEQTANPICSAFADGAFEIDGCFKCHIFLGALLPATQFALASLLILFSII